MRLAAGLARRFAATLTGAAAHPVCRTPSWSAMSTMPSRWSNATRHRSKPSSIRRRPLFRRAGTEGIGTDWRAGFADAVTHVIETAARGPRG